MGTISITERATFKRCRAMWDYTSMQRQALAPISRNKNLQLGTLIHQAHAAWIANPDKDPTTLFVYYAQQELANIKRQYTRTVGMTPSDEELQQVYDNIALGTAMMENYRKKWHTPVPQDFVCIAPEQTVIVPIPHTNHHAEGTLDTLLQHRKTKELYVHERKTYGQRPRTDALDMSDQFLGYIWLLTQLDIGHVGGIAYDGMWKRAVPPRGRTFDDLFLRLLLTREPPELARFEADLRAEANEMLDNPHIYLNRRWEGCFDCGMQRLCVSEMRGEDAEYIRSEYYTRRTSEKPTYEEPPQYAAVSGSAE